MSIKHIAGAASRRWRWGSPPVAATTPARATPATIRPSRREALLPYKAEGPVNIAFSAPGADHGWMAAITENARDEAEKLGDV